MFCLDEMAKASIGHLMVLVKAAADSPVMGVGRDLQWGEIKSLFSVQC